MIRLTLLWAAVLFLTVYAWKDWYRSLCGLIVLMAIIEHPDTPRTMLGVPGLNPWNLLLFVIILAWAAARRQEGLVWDLPGRAKLLLSLYLGLVLASFFRLALDPKGLGWYAGPVQLTSDFLINSVKWVIPGLLLFDGCRSRARLVTALAAILSLYVLLGLLVAKWMPPGIAFTAAGMSARALRRLDNAIGYHRVDLSVMLAGASWAILAVRSLVTSKIQVAVILGTSLIVLYAQALTGGRAGYLAWSVVGLALCFLRWPRYLALAPVVVVLVLMLLPGVAGRALEGLGEGDGGVDVEKLTAGRHLIWPLVIGKIAEAPLLGYGRAAMKRTGLTAFAEREYGEPAGNPHSAYLEMLLDSGLVGLVIVGGFYVYIMANAFALLRDRRSPEFGAVGGVTASLVLALLAGGITGQSFYPREGAVGMWCAIGLLLRVVRERARVTAAAPAGAAQRSRVGAARSSRAVESIDGQLWRPAPREAASPPPGGRKVPWWAVPSGPPAERSP